MKQESWTSNVIQRRQKLGNFCTDPHATHNPSSTVSFEVRSSAMQRTTTILTRLSKRKISSWRKLSSRGYDDAELSKADSSINFEDRQHFIKEKPKSTAIPLVFKTKYNPHFAGKYIKQALLKHWDIINKNVKLKMIFPKPPMIAYSRSENLRDSLVKAKLPTREEKDYTYDDLVRKEEDPPSSPTLQALRELELESRGFNMFIDLEEIEEDQKTEGPTPSNRRQDHEDHSSYPFRADTHGETYRTNIRRKSLS